MANAIANAKLPNRTGVMALKLGMTTIFDETGAATAVTVLHIDNRVVSSRTVEKDGYDALILTFGNARKEPGKSVKGQYNVNSVAAGIKMKEFRVKQESFLEMNSSIGADFYEGVIYIDITGKSKGKGFQGVIKRHNFKGGRATHGNSLTHRSGGSTGACQDPGKVYKGRKMAGHMGSVKVTKQNLKIVKIDLKRNLIFVKGAVPGNVNSLVSIKDAIKKASSNN